MPDKTGDVDKDLASVTAMGKRLKLEGKDLAQYIHRHMTGFGYAATRTYTTPKSGGNRGGFFSSGDDDDDDDDL
jgi:hypothetical protein